MGRLIDEEVALQRFIQETEASGRNFIHINIIKKLLQDIDTAYDAKKVVAELEEAKEIVKEYEKYHCSVKLDKAIDIVKAGGVK